MLNVQQTDDNEAILISDKEEKSIQTVIVLDLTCVAQSVTLTL